MLHFVKKRSLRWTALLAAVLLILEMVQLAALAEEIPSAKERSQMVRVHLTRLGVTDRLDLTLDCDYHLTTQQGTQLYFHRGSELAMLLRNGSIYLHYADMSIDAGGTLALERVQTDEAEPTGFYQTNFDPLYLGDLLLDISDGALRPVLRIHVEDYLLGVVPYEMGDSFPLEALKAQTVAARTYALRKQNAAQPYDLVDTTNDQVFRGYLPGSPLSERAVAETRGVCGFYKGELAQCYYSASNGGQMELVQSVWPLDGDYGYYTFGEDPYDVANPLSVVRSFELRKVYLEDAPYVLRKYLSEVLGEQLSALGYDAAPESIRVDGVAAAVLDTPDWEKSKRMTQLHLTLQISARTRSAASVRVVDADAEEVSLFVQQTQQPNVTFAPVVTLAPTATPEPVYGAFEALEEPITLDIPVFPTAEDLFGMDILSNYENEIWRVVETEEAFVLEARRYGHGVGMSQRGAQWMAGAEGKSYRDILSSYYPGMSLMRYPETPAPYALADEALAATPGPAPSPTPRPTLMPLSMAAGEGQYYAQVTEIAEDSSLNLRSEPSLNGKILTRLYKGQKLLVLEECPEEGWVKVCTDAIEGYVMHSFLTAEP